MKKISLGKDDSKRIIIYILLSLLMSALFLYTTKNLIYTILLLLISFLFFIFIIEKEYRKYKLIDRKTHECISFINNFIITLSINNSIVTTFDSIKDSFQGDLKEEVDNIENLNTEEKLSYLKGYFDSSIYEFFLKIINQYIFNGGNILQISQLLIFDSRKIETSLDNFKSVGKRKMIEFITMWAITMLILVIVQVALSMFYQTILSMSFYTPAIFFFFVMFLLFLYMFIHHQFNLSFINEKKEKEKNEDKRENQ